MQSETMDSKRTELNEFVAAGGFIQQPAASPPTRNATISQSEVPILNVPGPQSEAPTQNGTASQSEVPTQNGTASQNEVQTLNVTRIVRVPVFYSITPPHALGTSRAPPREQNIGIVLEQTEGERIRTYTCLSGFSILFCLMFGLIAIHYSSEAKIAKANGRYREAKDQGSTARIWAIVAYVCGLVAAGLLIALL